MTPILMQEKKPIPTNRRYAPRWNLEGSCSYRIDDDSQIHQGYAKDVSCSGACITTDQYCVINQKIHLALPLPDGDIVKVKGTVAWARSVDYQNEVGIHFYNASYEAQDAIVQYILNADKKKLIDHWFQGWEKK